MDFKDHYHGKGVVITGAAGLFGRGLAQTFAAAGARICVTDRDQDALDQLLAELDVPGSMAVAADLTSTPDMLALIGTVGRAWGAPDIVINNAAIYPSHFMLDMQIEDWDRMMDVNFRAPFVLTQGFAKQMIADGRKGSVINIGSGASRKMRLTAAPYCISKSALDRLTKGMAQELAQFGIRVNALEPGFSAGSSVSKLSQEHVDRVTRAIPLGRVTSMDDIGPAAMYLASDFASYVTGTTLTVDGGNSIGTLDVFQDKKTPL
ncbi:SDR family NAD(P)-dependent oxidoreductase [Paracoccus sediminilitoris]|uniref:SDR family NAD(P)-dependent oxidoreductase n=1 Tax=Paracoccus sediminilitoris TaxID=2202419 RepID=UPI0018F37A9E|nr:glucose 1-dehydrogenase [Paracoccus sediminilitoris]